MVGIAVWCESLQKYVLMYFVSPDLPSIKESDSVVGIWLPAWGVNPYEASGCLFFAEWN